MINWITNWVADKLNNLRGFTGKISFTYPKDKSEQQMLFSSSICQTDIAKRLRLKTLLLNVLDV